jgi:N6-L-threonylcarbamoyladenine synthase
MICLGIESTAHTFGIGIVNEKRILSNVKDSYTTKKGGMIPIDASNHHAKVKEKVLQNSLNEARIKIEDIDLIAFSNAPGLAPCLKEGMSLAKTLNKKYNIPLIPIHHSVAHIEVGKFLTKSKDPVLLYASGANTQVISFEGGKYRIFGETLDQGIGNFIDAFARYLGLGFPGGPKIDKLAKKSKTYIELPYSVKGMDVSFSGILTKLKQLYDTGKIKVEDLSYSLQETAFAMVLEVSERAMAHTDKNELLLGGGVACNSRLKEMAKIMCEERGAKCFIPDNSVLVDNGAMIAVAGLKYYDKNKKYEIDIKPYQRIDQVEFN